MNPTVVFDVSLVDWMIFSWWNTFDRCTWLREMSLWNGIETMTPTNIFFGTDCNDENTQENHCPTMAVSIENVIILKSSQTDRVLEIERRNHISFALPNFFIAISLQTEEKTLKISLFVSIRFTKLYNMILYMVDGSIFRANKTNEMFVLTVSSSSDNITGTKKTSRCDCIDIVNFFLFQ